MNDAHARRVEDVVHDLRNRLSIVRANVEAFIDGKLPATAERLGLVLASLKQIDDLIGDLRRRETPPGADVRPLGVDVRDVLGRELETVEAVASVKGVSLTIAPVRTPVAGRADFVADPERIGNVISNVLLNAIRYASRGGAVHVDVGRTPGQLEVDVTGSPTAESPYGVAVVKEFVEAQGGAVDVFSKPSGGTRMTIRLPGSVVAHREVRRPI